ncbi:MAG: substrate-binding periplasmic protein [Kiloniellaceae bacterium]
MRTKGFSARSASLITALALLAVPLVAAPAGARPLEAIEARGILSLCAHPNALPFSSRRGQRRGFNIELGEALARALGVRLSVDWVVTRYHAPRVDCDLILGSINDREAQQDRGVRLSKPYQVSGVALALRPDLDGVEGFDDLVNGERVGVLFGSMAAMLLGQRGATTVPFGFEDDMMAALGRGEIDAAAVSPASAAYYDHLNGGGKIRLVHAYEEEPRLRWTLAAGLRRADLKLVKAVNAALKRLMADGTIAAIYARYGIEHRPPPSAR